MLRYVICLSLSLILFTEQDLWAQKGSNSNKKTEEKKESGQEKKIDSEEIGSGLVDPKAGSLPDLTKGLADRAALAMSRNDWPGARKLFLEILKVEPSNALVLANLGAIEHQMGMLQSARSHMVQALAINPKLQQTWLSLGLISFDQGDAYFALSAFSRAVHEDPTDARPHQYLALVMKKLEWLDAAEAELHRAIELNPNYVIVHFNLALMYLERSPPSLELARRHYQKSLDLGGERDPQFEARLKELGSSDS